METSKDRLKRTVAWDVEPVLLDGEIDNLLAGASMLDKKWRCAVGAGVERNLRP